ncbi:PilZ domain-containing protein [Tsuneonella sp. HG094]|jgi:hypothetical protein
MSGVDTRHVNRDSLFLMAELFLDGEAVPHRVRVRNLSATGMMAEGDLRLLPGTHVKVALKNVPVVDGNVAWVHEQRFGIAFADEVDPKAPRSAINASGDITTPRYVRPSAIAPPASQTEPKRIRTI